MSLIDESARMAIMLKPEIIKTYPSVSSLLEDEPLLELEPVDVAIKMASYVFFSPKVRKTGQDVRADISSKLRDLVRSISPGTSIVFTLPTGIGGNTENIALIEHLTGFVIGRDIYYYYMPITSHSELDQADLLVGSSSSSNEKDLYLLGLIHDLPDTEDSNIVDIYSAELAHVIRILEHYTGLAQYFRGMQTNTFFRISLSSTPEQIWRFVYRRNFKRTIRSSCRGFLSFRSRSFGVFSEWDHKRN